MIPGIKVDLARKRYLAFFRLIPSRKDFGRIALALLCPSTTQLGREILPSVRAVINIDSGVPKRYAIDRGQLQSGWRSMQRIPRSRNRTHLRGRSC